MTLDLLHTEGSTVFLNNYKCQLLKLAFNLLASELILVDKIFPLKKHKNYIFKNYPNILGSSFLQDEVVYVIFSKMKHFFSNSCTYKDGVDANGSTYL